MADQAPKLFEAPPDGATAEYIRQQRENREAFERNEAERQQYADFFASCTAQDLADLKAELLDTLDPVVVAMVKDKDPATFRFLKHMIYAMVKRGKQRE